MSLRTVLTNGTVVTGYAKLKNCALYIDEKGEIGDIFNMRRLEEKDFPPDTIMIDVGGSYIMPGFIDSHIHGIGGFGTEDCKASSILGMSERLADFGVSAFMPTVYTDKLENMLASIESIVEAMGNEKGAKIMGVNIEGPFISMERVGAQNPEGVLPVDLDIFNQLIDAGKGHVICMTVAPELKHMRELALLARERNIVLLAGHTDATYENIMEGMQCGIFHSTHFFNAMSRLHHRNPGTVGAILIQREMQCEIICDGVHVHPELVKMLLREKPLDNIVMVTDSLKPTKQRSGSCLANGIECAIGADGAFVALKDPDLFIGSALTMLQGLRNVVEWEVPIQQASQMCATNPARIYNFSKQGMLVPGYKADVVVLDENLQIKGLFIEGDLIRDRFA
ncbi:MAG: N-acetylglucosamine-6-phosphate deacetylase [Sphaerochaeta sp.]|uniref:N-acetylglucosamine-6-phosphate deacetylase n=1 Tax=Sphaerochaeta sp. TaxID=1972642 RepID=UPI001D5E06D3|nr:N-acetylglucosamine-6-phosphate deacetylase [uncultured Sphaerochaeta sp.]MDD3056827.1 N-acetylglucosamine-6-phosphate deacetylase [Sphaerochaeta sp.]MDD3928883.1 N-acetylglucosamine-6-phosphate deacetylase [Sphaerochaeta sp.]NCC13215.1 N-acetylglucosamine-6-phosphate deacetylase [Spirochaetia bacterium]NCC88940.1 N-acetylglucosamine-6-phosphate deacetylase [Spirochaetia bacterium]